MPPPKRSRVARRTCPSARRPRKAYTLTNAAVTAAALVLAVGACVPDQRSAGGGRSAEDTLFAMHRVSGNALVLPRGYAVAVYADRLPDVRFLALGPDAAVYASQTGPGRVVRLPDGDGDGRADSVVVVADGLRHPHGVAFRGDTLYVAEEHRVVRLVPDRGLEIVVADLPEGGHFTRSIAFRDDELFVSIGSSCNVCNERDPRRAAILRFAADGTAETLFATGLRNSVGLAVHPETGELWATNNARDRLGDDLPPDRVNIIVEGGFYGWPQCYLPGTPNPEYRQQATRCDTARGPAVRLPAHTAPLGLAFYTGTQFPAAVRGDLFVALHGSWDRSFPVGYKVVRIPFEHGRPAGRFTEFVAGWQVGRRSWGRPVDVLVGADGSLMVSDDQGGRIFRVTHRGTDR